MNEVARILIEGKLINVLAIQFAKNFLFYGFADIKYLPIVFFELARYGHFYHFQKDVEVIYYDVNYIIHLHNRRVRSEIF